MHQVDTILYCIYLLAVPSLINVNTFEECFFMTVLMFDTFIASAVAYLYFGIYVTLNLEDGDVARKQSPLGGSIVLG